MSMLWESPFFGVTLTILAYWAGCKIQKRTGLVFCNGLVLAVMMIADYITGVLRAALGKSDKTSGGRLSASAGFRGLLKKSLMLLAVLLSALLDDYAGANGVPRTAVIWFYICNEGLSVLENLAGMGVPVPQRLRALLNAEKQKGAS